MLPIVEYEVFRDHMGVAAADPLEPDTNRLLDAISAQVRRMTGRDFEGDDGGTYTETIRIRGAMEFNLPRVPVRDVTSIAVEYFDGSVDDELEGDDWRLESAVTGRIRIRRRGAEYVQVTWRTTGAIPADLPEAVLRWGKELWDGRGQAQALASYQTGDDAESYFASLVGKPPAFVSRALLGAWNGGGGVV